MEPCGIRLSPIYRLQEPEWGMANKRRGFTLIEVLVVIAIIAILAAIIFPVFARAKDSGFRSSDISSMNTLRSAVLLYKEDYGGFPPQLLGYVNRYGPGPGNVVPANELKSYVFPKRVNALATFKPSYNNYRFSDITSAVYPLRDPAPQPQMDLNGDGVVSALDNVAGSHQLYGQTASNAYGAGDQVCRNGHTVANGGCVIADVAEFYRVSGYDVADVRGSAYPHLRYSLFWTEWGLTTGNSMDDPRQLGYSDPPENTLITWNSYFRDWNNATPPVPGGGRRDIAIFVGGSARPHDTVELHTKSWRLRP